MIFNASLQKGQFPSAWKTSVVVPIPKGKRDRRVVSSYRPISLTSSTSKVLERLAHWQILSYLLKNNLISPRQFGFLPGRSTLLELAIVVHQMQTTIADSSDQYIRGVFLDRSNAFDEVWHAGLLAKLSSMGFNPKWFSCYLSGRSIYPRVDDQASPVAPIKAGVPQGTVWVLYCSCAM